MAHLILWHYACDRTVFPHFTGLILRLPIWGSVADDNCFEDKVYWKVRFYLNKLQKCTWKLERLPFHLWAFNLIRVFSCLNKTHFSPFHSDQQHPSVRVNLTQHFSCVYAHIALMRCVWHMLFFILNCLRKVKVLKCYDSLKRVVMEVEGEDNSKSHFITCVFVYMCVYVCLVTRRGGRTCSACHSHGNQ